MALLRPITQTVNAFDISSEQPITFYFTVNGGDQVVGNKLTIKSFDTDEIVYQKEVASQAFLQILDRSVVEEYGDKITNGNHYYCFFEDILRDLNYSTKHCKCLHQPFYYYPQYLAQS